MPRRNTAPLALPDQSTAPASLECWTVYILRCADDTLYTGCTNDLTRRLKRHGAGQVKYTRGRLPVTLSHHEDAIGRGAALRREAAIKRLSRQEKLRLCDSNAPTPRTK
jgi:putative endonuclease